jgi:lipoate-protein ligase A
LRLWEWPAPAVILGAGCRLAGDVDEGNCRADGVPVLRRASGGGTVLLGEGCLVYSLVLAYDRCPALGEVGPSYAHILGRLRDALADVAPGIERAGISDLAAAGRKFSGSAQQRKRRHLLHHGTLLYRFAAGRVGRYLQLPSRQPDYRRGRDHETFLGNLPTDAAGLRRRLRHAWEAETDLPTRPEAAVRQLVADKYLRTDWVQRR